MAYSLVRYGVVKQVETGTVAKPLVSGKGLGHEEYRKGGIFVSTKKQKYTKKLEILKFTCL